MFHSFIMQNQQKIYLQSPPDRNLKGNRREEGAGRVQQSRSRRGDEADFGQKRIPPPYLGGYDGSGGS